MTIISTSEERVGTFFTFAPEGFKLSCWVTAGTTLLQHQSSGPAIDMTVNFDKRLVMSGSLYATQVAVAVRGPAEIVVERTGTLHSFQSGIVYSNTGNIFTTLRLVNHGVIETLGNEAIRAEHVAGSIGGLTASIINTGFISGAAYGTAITLGSGGDVIENTGTIVGFVSLGAGNDRIYTHLGYVSGPILGGAGDDFYVLSGTETIEESAGTGSGTDTVESYGDFALPDNVEHLTLKGSAQRGYGNAANNVLRATDIGSDLRGEGGLDQLYGGSGDDALSGGGDRDDLFGALGDDVLRGGEGDDRLDGGGGYDRLLGGGGADRLELDGADGGEAHGGAGDDFIVASQGDDLIDGGGGFDIVSYYELFNAIIVDFATLTVTGDGAAGDVLTAIEGVVGTVFNDRMTGSARGDYLNGRGGTDTLNGLDGADRIEGGSEGDRIDGGSGTDRVEFTESSEAVTISLLTGRGVGGDAAGDRYTDIENALGSAWDDTLVGSVAGNALDGGEGADTLKGGDGADVLTGGVGDDLLYGGGGADVFTFADTSSGNAGGWGQDTIFGWQDGRDKLSFAGSRLFGSFDGLLIEQDGADTVIGFAIGSETIRLVGVDKALLDFGDFVF